MKKKLIFTTLLGAIITIIIYNVTLNNKLNLLALGDGLASGMTAYNVNGYSYNDYIKDAFKEDNQLQNYNSAFAKAELKTNELIEMINDNVTTNVHGEDITIQQAISNANVIILAIGLDELADYSLNNNLTQKVINNYFKDMQDLLTLIRKYNREKVIVLGIYNAYEIDKVKDINKNLNNIAKKNNCDFLDISAAVTNKEYYFNDTSYYLNYKGHKKISQEILKVI